MLKENCRLKMQVYFGRKNGVQTMAEIVKINPRRCKVKVLEQRGNGRGSAAGSTWIVPYSSMRPAVGEVQSYTPEELYPKKLSYDPVGNYIEEKILEAIFACYEHLSPENLSCDGEASRTHIKHAENWLHRQLRGLQSALGFNVSESEIYDWYDSKRKYKEQLSAVKTG